MRDNYEARDSRLDQGMTWLRERACRLKERDLQLLALSNGLRTAMSGIHYNPAERLSALLSRPVFSSFGFCRKAPGLSVLGVLR